jgi:hypothetical protein
MPNARVCDEDFVLELLGVVDVKYLCPLLGQSSRDNIACDDVRDGHDA